MASVFKPEPVFNNPNGDLPFALYNPDPRLGENILRCFIAYDEDQKITRVFSFYDVNLKKHEKDVTYVDGGMEGARQIKDELYRNGWLDLAQPQITFTMPGESEPRNLNRKERRKIQKKLEKEGRKN